MGKIYSINMLANPDEALVSMMNHLKQIVPKFGKSVGDHYNFRLPLGVPAAKKPTLDGPLKEALGPLARAERYDFTIDWETHMLMTLAGEVVVHVPNLTFDRKVLRVVASA